MRAIFAFGAGAGATITARVLRGSAISAVGYVAGQGLRLASNLILTRLLFPEAFGLMALVNMVVMGVVVMTDLGLSPSIMQSRRGDDPAFLNTAWSVNLLLHGMYFVVITALAWPMAQFYAAPELAQLMPAVALSFMINGLVSPNIEHANRHLRLAPGVVIEIASQTFALLVMVVHAWVTGSIWALVVGQFVGAIVKVILSRIMLPGPATRPQWDPSAVRELIGFGKWILLSSTGMFLMAQGDKIILGKYLTMEVLGIYNIGFFLASFPMALAMQICGTTMIPVYRDTPPAASRQNFVTVQRMRFALSGAVLVMTFAMGLAGTLIVGFLYDPRYAEAGRIISLIACAQIPMVLGMTYPNAALAAGDSRGMAWLTLLRAVTQMVGFVIGVELAGLWGAIIGQALAGWVTQLAVIALARRHQAWDPLHDLIFSILGLLASGVILYNFPPW